jgi:hypothetical protein
MKRLLLIVLALITTQMVFAQKPQPGVFTPIHLPKYASHSGTNALPTVFRARLMNLAPNTSYKFYVRIIRISDTSSTSTTGLGSSVFIDSSGKNWRFISAPSLTTAGSHDTLTTDFAGTYEGWFAFYPSTNAAFAEGNNVYPYIHMQAIAAGAGVEKYYIEDSLVCLALSTSSGATKASAIFGRSAAAPKSIVALYDNIQGTGRPEAITYVDGSTVNIGFSRTPAFYTDSVRALNGRWGAMIPNDLPNGIRRVSSYSLKSSNAVYSNIDSNGIWGWGSPDINTTDPRNGLTPLRLTTEECALVPTDIQFWARNSSVNENVGTTRLFVRRRYANDMDASAEIFYVGGTADTGATKDFSFNAPRRIVFKPGYTRFDTTIVTIHDDNEVEGNEVATISLRDPINASIGLERTHSLTIVDNDIAFISFDPVYRQVRENAGRADIKVKIDKAVSTPISVRVLVKSKGDSTFIPGEFRLGSTNTDTLISIGKTTGPDSVMFFARIIDDTDVDPNDTVVLALRIIGSTAATRGDSLMTIVVLDNDRPPVYSFSRSTATVTEKAGNLRIRINVQGRNDLNSDFIFRFNQALSTATAGSDFTMNPLARIITVTPSDPDSVIVSLPIIDDELFEQPETMVFTLSSLTNSSIGKPDTLRVTLLSDDLPVYKIRQVTTENANGVADSIGRRGRIYGIVHGGNLRTSGLEFTVIDTTGGIKVLNTGTTFGYNVAEGDSVMVQGFIGQVAGQTVIQNLDTVRRISGSGFVRQPANVTSALGEQHESRIIRLRNVTLVNPADWPSTALAANTSKTFEVFDGTRNYTVYIDAETNVDGTAAPSTYFNLSGIGAQFDNTSPFTGNYAIVPRYTADVQNLNFPVLNFNPVSGECSETDDSSVLITIQIANPTVPVQFQIAVKGGTATPNADFNFNGRNVNLPAGVSSFSFKIQMFDDNLSEGQETLILAIRNNNYGTEIGTDSIYTLTIHDNEANSTKDFFAGSLNIHPNPASDQVVFSAAEAVNRILVLDLNGRVVQQLQSRGNTGVIDVKGMSPGVYLLRAETHDGRWYSGKVNVR